MTATDAAISEFESRKTIRLTNGSTNTQYPSAKCVYDKLQTKADKNLSNIENGTFKAKIEASGFEGGKVDSVNDKTGDVVLSKSDIGLSNVDNTSDEDKPISDLTLAALNNKADLTSNGKVDEGQIPTITTGMVESSIAETVSLFPDVFSYAERTTNKNQANGYAGLDAVGQISNSVIPNPTLDEHAVEGSYSASLLKNTICVLHGDDLQPLQTLTLNLPSGNYGDWIQVDFCSGSVAPTLTITAASSGISEFEFTPEVNTAYTFFFDYGQLDNTHNGWRIGYAAYQRKVV